MKPLQLPSVSRLSTMVSELCEFNDKKKEEEKEEKEQHGQNEKTIAITWTKGSNLV